MHKWRATNRIRFFFRSNFWVAHIFSSVAAERPLNIIVSELMCVCEKRNMSVKIHSNSYSNKRKRRKERDAEKYGERVSEKRKRGRESERNKDKRAIERVRKNNRDRKKRQKNMCIFFCQSASYSRQSTVLHIKVSVEKYKSFGSHELRIFIVHVHSCHV